MKPYYDHNGITIYHGDALEVMSGLPEASIDCCVTSPPYWGLRDYGIDGQLGLEKTHREYIEKMVQVFREVKRVLRPDGTLWLNLGDSYAGSWGNYHPNSPPGKHGQRLKETARWNRPAYQSQEFLPPTANAPGLKPKDLIGIPWRVAFALQADGWYLRSDIIWHKPNPMPESVKDRPTKVHEYIFLLSKSKKYFYDQEAVKEPLAEASLQRGYTAAKMERGGTPKEHGNKDKRVRMGKGFWDHPYIPNGRNRRTVWTIPTQPFPEAHFAVFPEKLVEPCIKAGCPEGGTVLDPFFGAGTTGLVSKKLNRNCIGIDLKAEYCEMGIQRLAQEVLPFGSNSPLETDGQTKYL